MKILIKKRITQWLSIEVEADSLQQAEEMELDGKFDEQWEEADFCDHEESPEFGEIK